MSKYEKSQRELDEKELVGLETEGFKFKSTTMLSWHESDEKYIGKKAKVYRIHPNLPYAELKFYSNGHVKWYPVEELRKHVEGGNKTEDELYGDIYKLLKKI